jgi:aminoglycoside phosphotransferase (APT) family kinase protein
MDDRDLVTCLPPELRAAGTTITRIAAGLSGAGVYRVEAAGHLFVLKVARPDEDQAAWRHAVAIQQHAAAVGLAPAVIHTDDGRRAIVTDFVDGRSFVDFYRGPGHQAAVDLLGNTVRRLHALPPPAGAPTLEARRFLAQFWEGLSGFPLPGFVTEGVQGVLTEAAPVSDGAPVLSHNDLNPSNFIYDGEAIVILDWATAGLNERFYDPAVLAMFLRMDEADCLRLLSAHEGRPVERLPDRFVHLRRLAAALAGSASLYLARRLKHPGATGAETFDAALPLGGFYQQLQTGAVKLGTPEGQWAFGLSLVKESLSLRARSIR